MLVPLLVLLAGPFQKPVVPARLRPDDRIEGEIHADDPVVQTEVRKTRPDRPRAGRVFASRSPRPALSTSICVLGITTPIWYFATGMGGPYAPAQPPGERGPGASRDLGRLCPFGRLEVNP